MFANLKIGVRLTMGFMALVVMVVALGLVAEWGADQLNASTQKLYRHPFAVSNGLANIETGVVAMHRSMKDVALAKSPEDVAKAVADVDAREKQVYEKFKLVEERYLGDKSSVMEVKKAFADWKPIRDEVIALMGKGQTAEAAAITKGKGAQAIADINKKLEVLIDFAQNKAAAFMKNADATNAQVELMVRGTMGFAVVFGIVVAYFATRSVAGPINAMTGVMGHLAENNLNVEVPFSTNKDEIGVMARSVAHFKTQLIRVRQLEKDQEEQKRRADAERHAALRKLADTFEASVGKVVQTVTSAATQLQASSTQMASTAGQTSVQATAVATSSQQASANVQTVASATEELATSISEISHQVERSQSVSDRARTEAGATTTQIRALSDNVNKIGEIVSLINSIASQTNLLALNATIEAARAGEAGKGFAVVANEVKGLASQTARATGEIAAQIQAVQEGTNHAVGAIDSISKVIAEMNEISASVAAAVQEQSAATGEIARNVEQAAVGTQEVSSNIALVEQAARDTGDAATQINGASSDLSRQAEYLREEVARFLSQVRADKNDQKLVEWTRELETGDSAIDRHHREMFDELNGFFREMMAGDGGKGALRMLAKLEGAMADHFREEESVMSRANFPRLSAHQGFHRQFLDRLATLKRAVEAGDEQAPQQLFDYAGGWLVTHIREEDGAFAKFVKEGGRRAA